MKMIFESAMADMTSLLKETVDIFSIAHEAAKMEPLFCVSNKQFLLMENVAHFSNYQVLRGCRQLCIDMCKQMKMKIEIIESPNIDFILKLDEKNKGIVVSFTSNYMPDIDKTIMDNIDEFIVVVLQETTEDTPVFYPPNSFKYRNYAYKNKIKNITIKQFFELLGRDDYNDFKECVGRYNYDAEQMLGITVSAIPTKKAMEKHKLKIQKELLSYFYEEELQTIFKEEEILDMKKWFEKNYEVLISNTDFSKSLISSEWYYDLQVMTDEGIEQTAIVAGYLKSLEQLLCSILLVLSEDKGNEFMFYTNKDGKNQTGKDRLPLTYANQKYVLTMAGSILKAIEGNKKDVLRKTKMTNRVIEYLENYVEKTRNGYMHKDNLYEWADIQSIRLKTYAAYFMVLGTFYIDVEKLSHIND